MKHILIVTLLVLVCTEIFAFGAEEAAEPAYVEFPESLGYQDGKISGSGLSYHRWTPSVGIQATAGIYYAPDVTWQNRTLDYTVGAEFQFPVYGEDFGNWLSGQLYIFTGLNHGGYIPVIVLEEEYLDANDVWVAPVFGIGSYTPTIGTGVGIGIEMILFRHFSFPIEVGYALDWLPTAPTLASQFRVDLQVQAGFRYRY